MEITEDDVARALASLESAEKSAGNAPLEGKIGKDDQGWLAGVARALAGGKLDKETGAITTTDKPKVYAGRDIDQARTDQHLDKMNGVLRAIEKVQLAAKNLFNSKSNMLPTANRGKKDVSRTMAEADATGHHAHYEKQRIATQQAINELVDVAGSQKAVEAIIAVYKSRIHPKLSHDTVESGRAKAQTKMDFLLSRAWSDFKTGGLKSGDVIRETDTRLSKEETAKGAERSQLRRAAEDGQARRPASKSNNPKNNPEETGLLGAVNYLQMHGTAFEGMLAAAVGRALRGAKTQPKLEFITDDSKPATTPRPTPSPSDTSASEVLHEALHAALQWHVYQNWGRNGAVEGLRNSLRQVLANAKAADQFGNAGKVISILKGLNEQDAVLELVSYGATMKDFRDFLKSLDSTDKSSGKSLMATMNAVWRKLTALVQRFLGVTDKVANDGLDYAVAALHDVTNADRATTPQGNVLEQATASLHQDNPAGAYDYSKNAQTTALFSQLFKGYSVQKLQQFAKTKIASALRLAFGNTEAGKAKAELWANRAVHLGKYMQDWAKPAAAVFSWFNSSINIHDIIAGAIRGAKNMRGIPIGTVTNFTARLETMKTEDALKAIGYLNGTNDATGLNSHVKEAIDELITARNNLLEQYRTSVGEDKVYEFLKNQPLMDSLIYVVDDRCRRTAQGSYGAHNMDRVRRVTEKTFIDNVFARPPADAKDLSGTFYKFSWRKATCRRMYRTVDSSMVNDPAVQAAVRR